MAWACYDGTCAGGVSASACPLREVRVTCGASSASWQVPPVAEVGDPGSAALAFAPAFEGAATSGSFTLRPTVQRGDGSAETLCSVPVGFSAGETSRTVLERAAAAVNASSACNAAGVTASVLGSDEGAGEIPVPLPFRLVLSAPSREGLQLLPAVDGSLHARVGLETVGLPVRMPISARLTLSGGARGGTITVDESSVIGRCRVTVATARGESAATVLSRLRGALSAPTSGSPACIQNQNPRDAVLGGDGKLRFVATGAVTIHNTDGGFSYTLDGEG